MTKIKYDSDLIGLMTLFESMTGAKVKDCIDNDRLIFVIEESDMGKAIGKKGANIRKIENVLKRKVKLVEFSTDIVQFVRNVTYPAEIAEIREDENVLVIQGKDSNSKAMLIGRERQNIKNLNDIVKRYFSIKEVKVV